MPRVTKTTLITVVTPGRVGRTGPPERQRREPFYCLILSQEDPLAKG